jgi:hypothetical protein
MLGATQARRSRSVVLVAMVDDLLYIFATLLRAWEAIGLNPQPIMYGLGRVLSG